MLAGEVPLLSVPFILRPASFGRIHLSHRTSPSAGLHSATWRPHMRVAESLGVKYSVGTARLRSTGKNGGPLGRNLGRVIGAIAVFLGDFAGVRVLPGAIRISARSLGTSALRWRARESGIANLTRRHLDRTFRGRRRKELAVRTGRPRFPAFRNRIIFI